MFDRRLLANFDWVLFLTTLAISLLGVAAIYSASKGYPGQPEYWLRQLYWLGISLGTLVLLLLVDFRTIGRWSYAFHALVILSLAGLLIYGAGDRQVDRWFNLGPIAIQPSEFAKFSAVLAIAYYFRDGRRVGSLGWRGLAIPLLIVLVPFFLIVNQPDLGTALLLVITFFPMVIMAGLRIRILLYMAVAGLLAIVALVGAFQLGYYQVEGDALAQLRHRGVSSELVKDAARLQQQKFYLPSTLRNRIVNTLLVDESDPGLDQVVDESFHPFISSVLRPYQQKRLITFLNPDQDPLGAGYHVIQSKVAIGSGGLTGKGFGNSTQGALNFLPARHTDFIFSIFSEEWGFLGDLTLLGLYLLLIYRGLSIITETHDRFSAFATMGVVSIVTFQVLINVGMAIGLLPVVGVPLPFFSYGGSSMITLMAGVAILLNIRMRRFLWA
jgi:rod shape determining protein RodA